MITLFAGGSATESLTSAWFAMPEAPTHTKKTIVAGKTATPPGSFPRKWGATRTQKTAPGAKISTKEMQRDRMSGPKIRRPPQANSCKHHKRGSMHEVYDCDGDKRIHEYS